MKRTISILFLRQCWFCQATAQDLPNHGLVLTGSVQGVETKCIDGKPFMQMRLYMVFRNDGDAPLILITPSYFFTTKVNFIADKLGDPAERIVSADSLRYHPYLDNPWGPASKDDYDPAPRFISASEPPHTLAPGGYLEFPQTVWVKSGFSIRMRSDTTQKECEQSKAKPVPKYPSFYLEYHLSLKKYDRGTDLAETLSSQWKRFGHLLLDSNGDVSYKSERIIFSTNK